MAVAIAVLGKEVCTFPFKWKQLAPFFSHVHFILSAFFQNSPKYFACVNSDQELQFRYKMHTALDFIEEKLSSAGKPSNDVRELYLGQLYAAEDYKLYTFIIKIVPLLRLHFTYIL